MEVNGIKKQICDLVTTEIEVNQKLLKVSHDLVLTMCDGKICQILSETASCSTCIICGAKPSEMNDLKKISQKQEKTQNYCYGLSTLHAWIRFMELILHISYNLSFQKWSARTPEEKVLKEAEKRRVQQELKNKLSLKVDIPRQGSGTSNDGNTARKFFANPECVAGITKVDLNLIKQFAVILQVLASGKKIQLEKFQNYCFVTAQLFVSNYPWFYMPASVHKILLHGSKVIESLVLPIGMLSEEAQEARNKDYKNFREFHTRKCSRLANNEDIFHLLLISSDPLITSKRHILSKKHLNLDPEALALILD